MKTKPPITLILAVIALTVGCASSPDPSPDNRSLGDVTAHPQECDLISANAIKIATGLSGYTAFGTKKDTGQKFESCTVSAKSGQPDERGLMIEVFEPSPASPEGLENTRLSNRGNSLPNGLGPGFAALRKNAEDQTIAFVYGWTPDYKRLLTINIVQSAPGRDSLADATEFFRQLKPVLLDSPD